MMNEWMTLKLFEVNVNYVGYLSELHHAEATVILVHYVPVGKRHRTTWWPQKLALVLYALTS